MSGFNTAFIEETKEFVGGFIGENFSEKICYHNIDHTLEVVEASEVIGRHCKLTDRDLEIVIIAAWFHDTGYFLGCENHEEASSNIAKQYLQNENIDPSYIHQVVNCILSTKLPQKPRTILEQIICDADLVHLASDQFLEKSKLLLHELKLQNRGMSDKMWLILSKEFIETHKYHTQYGKNVLFPGLKNNLSLLNSKILEIEE